MVLDLGMTDLTGDVYQTIIHIIRNLLKQLGLEDEDDASDGAASLAILKNRKCGPVIPGWSIEP